MSLSGPGHVGRVARHVPARLVELRPGGYARHVRSLSVAERLELVAATAQDIAAQGEIGPARGRRSILDLEGLGAEIRDGIDAQD